MKLGKNFNALFIDYLMTVDLLQISKLFLIKRSSIELNMELPRGETESIASSQVSQEQDELTARLARLRHE